MESLPGFGCGPTGDTFVSEPGQIPTIALGDTLNGVALDLDADSRCGLLSGRAAAETDAG